MHTLYTYKDLKQYKGVIVSNVITRNTLYGGRTLDKKGVIGSLNSGGFMLPYTEDNTLESA